MAAALVVATMVATGARAEPAVPDAAPAAATAETDTAIQFELGRIAGRTATYQAMSSFNDFVYGAVFAGGIAAGGMLAAASLATEPFVHFLHETAWRSAGPPADREDALRRVPVKAATYTLANSGRVFASAWLLTGNPLVAAGMVAFNAVGDAAVYAINDAAWAHFTGEGADGLRGMGASGAP